MELLYTLIKKINKQQVNLEFCFTNEFDIHYEVETEQFTIKKLASRIPKHFFSENVEKINVIVGQNGMGKSTLMNMLGLKGDDLRDFTAKHNEWINIYRNGTEENFIAKCFTVKDGEQTYEASYDVNTTEIRFENQPVDSRINRQQTLYLMASSCNDTTHKNQNNNYNNKQYIKDATYEDEYNFLKEYVNKIANQHGEFIYDIKFKNFSLEDALSGNHNGVAYQIISTYFNKSAKFLNYKKLVQRNFTAKERCILKIINANICYLLNVIYINKDEIDADLNLKNEVMFKKYFSEVNVILDAQIKARPFNYILFFQKKILELTADFVNGYQKIPQNYCKRTKELLKKIQNLDDKYFMDDHDFDYISINIVKDRQYYDLREIIKFISDNNENEFLALDNFLELNLPALSTGQRQLITMLASIKSAIDSVTEDKSIKSILLLLDEPGVYLHPEWSRNLIIYLIDLLKIYKIKFNIIIATHSPFIVSDIPKELVMQIKNNAHDIYIERSSKTYAANLYDILSDTFFMSAPIGKFAEEKIDNLLTRINKLEAELKCPEQRIDEIQNEISLIGDPLLRSKLTQVMDRITSKDNRISKIKAELRALNAMDDNK